MIGDTLDQTLMGAPELFQAPDLAVAAADTPDPTQTGQALAQTVNSQAQDQATAKVAKRSGGHNLLSGTLSWLGHAAGNVGGDLASVGSSALHIANLPLATVQHTYRTLHDIEARHGPLAGLLEGLGVVGAGALAGLLAAPTGGGSLALFGAGTAAILGGEAAATGASRLLFKDSWDRTANGEAYRGIYNRQTGQYSGGPVSLGRDLASTLPHPLRFMSGVTDGLADLTLDPLARVGGGFAQAREARLTVSTVDGLDKALSSPLTGNNVRRAFDEIARLDGSEVALKYPKLAPLAGDLGKLHTADRVEQYFRDALGAAEHLDKFPGELPNLPLTRIPGRALRDFIRTYDGPGQAQLRVFQLLPTDFDEKLMRFSNKDFDPSGSAWAPGVYRALRFGQSDATSRMVVDSMLATDDLGVRRDIYKNGIFTMLTKGRGLAEDNQYAREIMQKIENTTGDIGGPEQVYATSADGRNLSLLRDGERTRAAAVLENQTGRWAFPDYLEVVRAERSQKAWTHLMGAGDDLFYHYITQNIFKRAALLTGGFALRIAAAEAIPAAFREGFFNLIRSTAQLHLGANEALGAEEAGHVGAAVGRLVGGVTRRLLNNPDDIDLATRAVLDNNGHLVPAALDADAHGRQGVSFLDTPEGRQTSLLDRAMKKVPPQRRFGNEFGIFGAGPDHADTWQAAMKEAANSELGVTAADALHTAIARGATLDEATRASTDAVRNLLDAKPDAWLGKFERHFASSTDGVTPHEDWAKVVTDSVKGLVGHPYDPERINLDLLHTLSEGDTPALADLKAIPGADRPFVKGRVEMPYVPEGPVAKVAQLGYHHVIDPLINFLSREPLYFNELKKQYAPLKALVDEGVVSGDEALRVAQIRAVHNVTPFIHNPLERSQFAQLARNFMPFYFAQTQAYRRVGRLIADDPGAFRKFQLSSSALHEVGHVTTDDQGQQQFVYPGGGFLSHATLGGMSLLGFKVAGSTPVSFSGDVRSLNTVFPFNEEGGGIGVGPIQAKFGPLVSWPLHALQTLFPETWTPIATKVLGPVGASGGVIDQLIPNTPVRNLLKAQGLLPSGNRELQNAMVQTMQSLAYQQTQAMSKWTAAGHNPDDPGHPAFIPLPSDSADVRQQFIDRVKNQSRVLLYMKAALSLIAPAAPRVTAGDIGLQKEFRDLIASNGPDGKPLGLSGAVTEFLHRHPDATPYTVAGSQSQAQGAYLPANQAAQDFIDTHLDLIHKYPYAAAWLIPQTSDKYSQAVYNEQLAMGLRKKKAPDQVMNDIYIALGNDQFYNRDLPYFNAQLAKVKDDPQSAQQLRQRFNSYLSETFGPQNPIWWDDFKSADRQHQREIAVQQMIAMFQNGDAPDSTQTAGVRGLLADYRSYANQVVSGRQDGWSAIERDALNQRWHTYLDSLAQQAPQLAPVIHKVFRALVPTTVTA